MDLRQLNALLAGQHRTDEAEQVWIIDLERDALHSFTLEV